MAGTEKNVGDVTEVHCGQCGGQRKCDIKGVFVERGGDEVMDWRTEWSILECRGCSHVFARTVGTNSEDYDHVIGESGEDEQVYAETVRHWPASSSRRRPGWMTSGGIAAPGVERLDGPIAELYGALDAELPGLSVMGMRTVVDVAADLLGIDPSGTFAAKLNELTAAGFVDGVQRKRLEVLVEAGNASAHRGWTPTTDDLDALMDVLEHFVEAQFVVPAKNAALEARLVNIRRTVPPKQSRTKHTGEDGADERKT